MGGTSWGPPGQAKEGGLGGSEPGLGKLSEQPCSQLHQLFQLYLSFRAEGSGTSSRRPSACSPLAPFVALGCFLFVVFVSGKEGLEVGVL